MDAVEGRELQPERVHHGHRWDRARRAELLPPHLREAREHAAPRYAEAASQGAPWCSGHGLGCGVPFAQKW